MEKKEKPLGTVIHWYDKIGVAVVKLGGKLGVGEKIKVKKGDEEFETTVSSIQIDHKDVPAAKKGDDAAIKLSSRAKEGATIFRVE
jgi:translation initiation factor IF-2